jgi:hypothetical protein
MLKPGRPIALLSLKERLTLRENLLNVKFDTGTPKLCGYANIYNIQIFIPKNNYFHEKLRICSNLAASLVLHFGSGLSRASDNSDKPWVHLNAEYHDIVLKVVT